MHVGNGQVEKENRLTKRSLEKYIPIKIHHTGKSHWVTSLQDKKDGTVYVLDSYSKTFTLTPSLGNVCFCVLIFVCTTVTKLNQVCQSINPTIINICLLLDLR
jgi:hypothetical protein